jgi:hypothetical protein
VTVERWIASVDLGVGASGKRLRKKITGGRQLDQLTVAQVEAWLRVEAESGARAVNRRRESRVGTTSRCWARCWNGRSPDHSSTGANNAGSSLASEPNQN